MVSSPDQTPQVPFMFFLIIHYFERPAPSVRLVKSIHLRALPQILDAAMFETCVFANCNETTSMNDFVDEPILRAPVMFLSNTAYNDMNHIKWVGIR